MSALAEPGPADGEGGSSAEQGQKRASGAPANPELAALEAQYMELGSDAERHNDLNAAVDAYTKVTKINGQNVQALLQLATIFRCQARFTDAVECLGRIIEIDGPSGEVHGAIGHCYLTLSQTAEGVPAVLKHLGKCYSAYHEAAARCNNDPNLWYGIGLLYDKYGTLMPPSETQRECFAAAEEALRSVLHAAPQFEKRSEVLYRYAASHAPPGPSGPRPR